MDTIEVKAGYFLNVIEVERYKYIADNGKVNMIIQKANKLKLNYEYVLCYIVKQYDRHYYFSVHFMNSNNREVAYASVDLFDMVGFVIFETPRIWGIEFLIKKSYFRIDRKDFNDSQNIMRPEDASNHNEWFKNMENNVHYIN